MWDIGGVRARACLPCAISGRVELVEDRRATLEALGHIDSAADLSILGAHVISQIRRHL